MTQFDISYASSRRRLRRFSGCTCFLVMMMGYAVAAPAQTNATGIKALTPFELEQERMKKLIADRPAAYVDKVMDAAELSALPVPQASADASSQLGFQSFAVEGRYDHERHSGDYQNTTAGFFRYGLRTDYRLETLNFGRINLQADFRKNGSGAADPGLSMYAPAGQAFGRRITLRDDAFPVTSSIYADMAAGDIYSELADAFRRSFRLSLGSSVVRGGSLRFYGSEVDLRFGMGKRGVWTGGPYPGYESSQGDLAWAGMTWRLPHEMYVGWQSSRATAIPVYLWDAMPYGLPAIAAGDSSGTALVLGYGKDQGFSTDDGFSWRLLHVGSKAAFSNGRAPWQARGVFLEASIRQGRYLHNVGAYRADPNLYFGDQFLSSDNRGAYWRTDYSGTRWNWGLGADVEQFNPGRALERSYGTRRSFNGNFSWRISGSTSAGANAVWGDFRSQYAQIQGVILSGNRTLYASVYLSQRFYNWGQSRLVATMQNNNPVATNAPAATGWEIQWEHDWVSGRYETMRPEFVTTLGWATDRSTGDEQTYPTAGLRFRYWPGANWNVGGSLLYTSRSGNLYTSRGLSGSFSAEGDLGGGWYLGASASSNQAVVNQTAINWAGTAIVPLSSRSSDKYFSIYLRWEGSRGGAPYAVAGVRSAAAGAGSIEGVVYYDANRDGVQQAGEVGLSGIEVLLDGGYRATTDSQGRYRFAVVATGRHQLTVNLDTVPLPWGRAAAALPVEVSLRQSTRADLALVRQGE